MTVLLPIVLVLVLIPFVVVLVVGGHFRVDLEGLFAQEGHNAPAEHLLGHFLDLEVEVLLDAMLSFEAVHLVFGVQLLEQVFSRDVLI